MVLANMIRKAAIGRASTDRKDRSMHHEMKLNNAPFQAVKSGSKTVELRLLDEKRALVKAGDTVLFKNVESGESLACIVVNIYNYANFEELYAHHNKIAIGYKEWENADPKDMFAYYSREAVEKYGVVGIEIKLTK